MPRRSILSAAERESLLMSPDADDKLIRHYTFNEADLSLIRQRRGDANRLGVLDAIDVLRGMNSDNARKVPTDAPTEFIKPRWAKLVLTEDGIDRRYYELCALRS